MNLNNRGKHPLEWRYTPSKVWWLLILAVLVTACEARPASQAVTTFPPIGIGTSVPTSNLFAGRHKSQTPAITTLPPTATEPAAPTFSAISTPTAAATLTLTPDPYEKYTIDYLTARAYGEGSLEIQKVLTENSYFTRYLVTYPSDDLIIYGFMNVPKRGKAPYPVVIALHGYIDPAIYQTLDYTTGYADTLARAGFLVIHPNLRDYPPSDSGDNLFRVGMAVDVLNLIAIVKGDGSQPGPLEAANPGAIGLWGHSMGGGIATRVVTVNRDVRAAVLYAPMTGDEKRNYTAIFRWYNGLHGAEELRVPEDALLHISPVYFFREITAAVSIHHGESDTLVPLQWSLDTCSQLKDLGKTVECFTYPGQPHTFHPDGEQIFMERVIDFFNRYLR